MDLSYEDEDKRRAEEAQALDPEIAEKLAEGLPILSKSARSRIQTATAAAHAKIREARLYLEQAVKAEVLLASVEFSLGASSKRPGLNHERLMFSQKARRSTKMAVGTLFEAYATEHWDAAGRIAVRFREILSPIGEAVVRTLACPDLAKQISEQITLSISAWTQRIKIEDRDDAAQVAATEAEPPLPTYWRNPTPLHYFETWDLTPLNQQERDQVKANLLSLHSALLEGRTGNLAHVECWRRAYDIFAQPLHAFRHLDEPALIESIPAMVLDASASGRWKFGPISYGEPMGRYCLKFGNEYYDEWFIRGYFYPYIEGRIHDWRAKLTIQGKGGTEKATGRDESNKSSGQKRVRRTDLYKAIDKALHEFATARPRSHEEVFGLLDGRKVPIPSRKPFEAAGGWLKGFRQNPHDARAWLSQAWHRLGLPAFLRGPKK